MLVQKRGYNTVIQYVNSRQIAISNQEAVLELRSGQRGSSPIDTDPNF